VIQKIFYLKKGEKLKLFNWPDQWEPRVPLVKIISYCLMDNHFHLLLQEIREGGISIFMQKFGLGFTNYMNSKYKESGSIFQGTYKAKLIGSEEYMQYADVYVQLFNPFQLFDGGVVGALNNFDKAFQFALDYQFSSLGESLGVRNFSIIDRQNTDQKLSSVSYKEFARDALLNHRVIEEALFD
jgi:putative transposase